MSVRDKRDWVKWIEKKSFHFFLLPHIFFPSLFRPLSLPLKWNQPPTRPPVTSSMKCRAYTEKCPISFFLPPTTASQSRFSISARLSSLTVLSLNKNRIFPTAEKKLKKNMCASLLEAFSSFDSPISTVYTHTQDDRQKREVPSRHIFYFHDLTIKMEMLILFDTLFRFFIVKVLCCGAKTHFSSARQKGEKKQFFAILNEFISL